MRYILLTTAGLAMIGFGVMSSGPAYAGMTSDQLAAEGWPAATQAPSTAQLPNSENGVVGGSYAAGPGNPNNGLAQDRITGAQIQQR